MIDVNLNALARTAGTIVLPVVGGLGLVAALIVGARALYRNGRKRLIWLAPATLGVASFAGVFLMVDISLTQTTVRPPTQATEITLPAGFQIEHYYDRQVDTPSALAFGPDGRLYVASYGGKIIALHDSKGAGHADRMTVFADGLDKPTALAWRGNDLYVHQAGKVTMFRDTAKRGRADWSKDLVINLPSYVYPLHVNLGLAFGPDGRLYFGVGSTTNAGAEENPMAARIWSMNPDGSDLQEFAYGVRNPFGIAFNSAGDLFATDNAPNWEGTVPGDELKYIAKGGRYGFPEFGEPPPNADWQGPAVIFPPHVSPTGIAFYNSTQFPANFRGNAFVAFWNTGRLARVQLAKMADGTYAAEWHYFAQGLKNPIAVAVGADGSLFVADFGSSAIYRVTATDSINVAHSQH